MHAVEGHACMHACMYGISYGWNRSHYDQLLCCQHSDPSDPRVIPPARVRDCIEAAVAAVAAADTPGRCPPEVHRPLGGCCRRVFFDASKDDLHQPGERARERRDLQVTGGICAYDRRRVDTDLRLST